jgi:hypothetical protein
MKSSLQFFPPASARFSVAEVPEPNPHTWTMKERRDLKITLWVSVLTAIAAIAVPIFTAVYVAGHKDQALIEIQNRQAALERRIDGMRETLDKILLKTPQKSE